MIPFTHYNPTKIHLGRGKIDQLPLDCPPDAAETIMVVTDPDSARLSGALDAVCQLLSDRDLIIFDQVMENPSYEIIDEGAKLAQSQSVDLILGIGGGSAMDAAKGIALASQQKKPLRAYAEGSDLDELPLPIICVPTTAGTGSEVTPFAVFSDHKKQIKVGYESDLIYPTLAIIDPRFCETLPEKLVVTTGLDALTHAVEALLSTHSNPIADALSIEALNQVLAHLPLAVTKDPTAIDKMSYAALLSGLAISQKSTILLHIMAYPLTTHHHLQHGLANALLLPTMLDFLRNENQCPQKLHLIDTAFAPFGGVRLFLESLGVTLSLNHYGVKEASFAQYADQTLAKGDVAITPAEVDKEKMIAIYKAAF
jgi:alcohol dehydrogenase class IV